MVSKIVTLSLVRTRRSEGLGGRDVRFDHICWCGHCRRIDPECDSLCPPRAILQDSRLALARRRIVLDAKEGVTCVSGGRAGLFYNFGSRGGGCTAGWGIHDLGRTNVQP